MNLRSVPRLYDDNEKKFMPGSWWMPGNSGNVHIKCSNVKGEEHVVSVSNTAFDERGIGKNVFKCQGTDCTYSGRLRLEDFHGKQPVKTDQPVKTEAKKG